MPANPPPQNALAIAAAVFLLNSVLFTTYLDADRRGFGDAEKGFDQYNALLEGYAKPVGVRSEQTIRWTQLAVTCGLLLLYRTTGLITPSAFLLYLIWPYSAFLATKIKQEFLLFPMAFFRNGRSARDEALLCGLILVVTLVLGEKNGFIIIFFRLLRIALQLVPARRLLWVTLAGVVVSLILDRLFGFLAGFSSVLAAYHWTRDHVNPEYSLFETLACVAATFHLGVTPQTDWWFAIPMGGLVLLVAGYAAHRHGLPTETKRELAAFTITAMFFTSMTHAFQNTRYYYFGVKTAFPHLTSNVFWVLVFLSLVHTILSIAIYENVYR